MSSIIVCDLCGKEISQGSSFYRKVEITNSVGKGQRAFDFHQHCSDKVVAFINEQAQVRNPHHPIERVGADA